MSGATTIDVKEFARWATAVLGPDKAFFRLALVYGVAVSLLSLATPISVQVLINSVANTALPAPLLTLACTLFVLLALQGVLNALRTHVMEVFRRRFFARLVAEITLRAVHAQNPFFVDDRRGDLFNRFFDVNTVQKAMPSLLIGLFTILLQAAMGLILTSFYHPFFLGFNLLFLACAWAIWRLWSRRAMQSAIELSHAKYDTAHWLESVGGSNGFYKSGRHVSYAMQRSEALTARYVAAHARHFRFNFMQTGLYLGLYAVASAALLGLGGWLVIQGQLSLGQLVAAELILSSTFYGVSQLGSYLDVFYDLVAGLEELHRLYDIPQESAPIVKADPGPIGVGGLTFRGVQAQGARFDIAIEGGARITAVAEPHVERMFSDLLKRHLKPSVGIITLGGSDLGALDIYRLRSEVIVLDRPVIVESTIRNYLSLAAPEAPPDAILDALRAVGLERRVTRLLGGLDMPLSSSGWPLSLPEMMRLKLAGALLARPRVLVLSPIYDMLPPKELAGVADRLGPETILIAFTRRPRELALGDYLHIASSGQTFVASADDLEKLDGAEEVERAVSS